MFEESQIEFIDAFLHKILFNFPSLQYDQIAQHTSEFLGVDLCNKCMLENHVSEPADKKAKINEPCVYITKTKNQGPVPCKNPRVPGTDLCSKHCDRKGKGTKKEGEQSSEENKSVVKTKKQLIPIESNINVIQSIINRRLRFIARKSKFNNYVQQDTGFIVDPETQMVKGTENQQDGSIVPLTYEQVQMCLQFNFLFERPKDFPLEDEDDKMEAEMERANQNDEEVDMDDVETLPDDDDDEED